MRIKPIFFSALIAATLPINAFSQYRDDSDCENARIEAESAASKLSSYAERLQQCVYIADFSDDCYIEFRRVKSSYDDYESAVSNISTYCE